jgi:hypothetical protein
LSLNAPLFARPATGAIGAIQKEIPIAESRLGVLIYRDAAS